VPAGSDWRTTLPEELKAHKSLEKFKDPAALAKSYLALETYQGRSVAIPGPEASPADQATFWAKVGAHDAPEKYTVSVPEGTTVDAGMLAPFQAAAHAAHLTQDQWAAMVSTFRASPLGDSRAALEAMKSESERMLKAEWGGAFEHRLGNAEAAVAYVDRQSGAGFGQFLKQTGFGNRPEAVKHFEWLSRQFMEHGALPKDAQTGGALGPESAKQRIAEIRADRAHPFHRGDKDALAEMARLYEVSTAG